jgi:hypothetical protein
VESPLPGDGPAGSASGQKQTGSNPDTAPQADAASREVLVEFDVQEALLLLRTVMSALSG